MSKHLNRAERKEELKQKYNIAKERIFLLIFLAAVFLALVAILFYGISIQADPFLLFVLLIIIIILVPVSVFLVDLINWER